MSQFGTKEKLWVASALIAVLLVSIALVSLISFSNTQQKLARVTQQYQPKMLSAMQLTTHFYHSLSVLGNYMVEQDADSVALYENKVADIDATLDELIELTRSNEEPLDANQLHVIRSLVDEIKTHNQKMLELASNIKRNMPAMGIAVDWMEPLSLEMTHLLNELVLEADEQDLEKIAELTDSLLYNWAMVISQLRSYLAFRNDGAIAELNLYLEGVYQHQRELRNELQRQQPMLLDLLDEFNQSLGEYQTYLKQVIDIHSSSDWRADSHLMRSSITPTLKHLTRELDNLVGAQKARIEDSNRELADQIQSAENTIRIAIQIAMLVSAVVIILTLRTRGLLTEIHFHKKQKAQAEHKAKHDILTKLPNRAYFDEHLKALLGDREHHRNMALMFIDLDGFKAVNDDVGHDAGDHVLRESSRRLQRLIGSSDMVARLGGDEFVVLIDRVEQRRQVETLASDICKSLREPFPFQAGNLQIGCSIGVLMLEADELLSNSQPLDDYFSLVLKRADEAMYQAKRSGKNRYCVYGEPLLKLA